MKNGFNGKSLSIVLVMLIWGGFAKAAPSFDDEVNAELEKMYGTTKPAAPAAVQVNVSQAQRATPVQAVEVSSASGVLQTQKQPTTVIEASPLTESNAEKLRKARAGAEIQTEQKIVEKLETSRLEDEKKRAEVLFGDRFNQLNNPAQPAPVPLAPVVAVAPTPAPAPVVVVPAPVAVQEVSPAPVKDPGLDKEAVKAEISAALADFKAQEEAKPKDKLMFGALLGVSDYPTASNVKGQYAAGFSIAKKFQDRFVIEAGFQYANFQVQQQQGAIINNAYYPRVTEMDQYQGVLAAKVQLFSGMLRPVLGGVMAYTNRSFTDVQFGSSSNDAKSDAVDVGALIGADLELSESFSLGIDFRSMYNLTSKTSAQFQQSYIYGNQNQKPIEQLNYYTLGIVGRTSF